MFFQFLFKRLKLVLQIEEGMVTKPTKLSKDEPAWFDALVGSDFGISVWVTIHY